MTTRLTTVVALILAVAVTDGCSRKSRAGEYYDEAKKFSIIPPASWEPRTDKGVDVVFESPTDRRLPMYQENIGVAIEASGSRSLDDFVRVSMTAMYGKTRGDQVTASATDFDFGNIKAKRLVIVTPVEGRSVPIQTVAYVAVKEKKAYIITGSTIPERFSTFEATFDACARTFRVE